MKKYIVSICISLSILSTDANAQVARDHLEKAGNHIEIQKSKQQLKRDKKEAENFEDLIKDFKLAYLSLQSEELDEVRNALIRAMDREINQSISKANSGHREVKRSTRELQNSDKDLDDSERDMLSSEGRKLGKLRDFRDDRRDRKDDLRDLNDDRHDLILLDEQIKLQEDIRFRFNTGFMIQPEVSDINSIPEIQLLNRFHSLLLEDIKRTAGEWEEDRKELREDRQELREDRRERREERRERKGL